MRRTFVTLVAMLEAATVVNAASAADGPEADSSTPQPPYTQADFDQWYQRQREIHQSREEALKDLSPDVVASYSRRFGVDEVEARDRLATQTMVNDLSGMLEDSLGEPPASLWFDNDNGQWVIALTRDQDADAVRKVLANTDLTASSRIVETTVKDHDLIAPIDELSRKFAYLQTERYGFQLAIIPGGMELTVSDSLPEGDAAELEAAVRRQADVRIKKVPFDALRPTADGVVSAGYVQCNTSPRRCNTLTAGAQYLAGTSTGCTVGFIGIREDNSEPWLVTAGHCVVGDEWGVINRGGYFDRLGPVNSNSTRYNGGADANSADGDGGRVHITDGDYPRYKGYHNWTNNTDPYIGDYTTTNSSVGTMVCKHGTTTGTTCGPITSSYLGPSPDSNGRYFKGLMVADACSQPGDSGGPWTIGHTAVGVTSHGNGAGSCALDAWLEPVHRIRERTGVTPANGNPN